MADIIQLDQEKTKREKRSRKERYAGICQIMQCAHCQLRCSRCGIKIEQGEGTALAGEGFRLCAFCREEYQDYILKTRGKPFVEAPWYNQEWLALWEAWLNYQKTLITYVRSSGYGALLKDLEED